MPLKRQQGRHRGKKENLASRFSGPSLLTMADYQYPSLVFFNTLLQVTREQLAVYRRVPENQVQQCFCSPIIDQPP